MRLRVCEAELQATACDLAEGASNVLRAAVILAVLIEGGYYQAAKGSDGVPRHKNASAYSKARLESWGLGFSRSRVSRLVRAGHFYLKLIDSGLPTPRAAESLILMTPLGSEAVSTWKTLTEEAGGRCPTLKRITEYLATRKPAGESVKRENPWRRVAELATSGLDALSSGSRRQELEQLLQQIRDYAIHAGKLTQKTDTQRSEAPAA